ncbi:MAG: ABC transporter substrate-binding protein [Meiothermus sp.]|nr:ABC transporter substrate-binding protein [Meiothermus sp.]
MYRFLMAVFILSMLSVGLAQQRGGTLVIALARDVESTDPMVGGTIDATIYNNAVGDPFVILGEDGVAPWIIESWSVNAQGVYTWKIRRGVNFQDGTPLNAEAVKFTIERYRNPENGLRYGSYFARTRSIEVVDDFTLRITNQSYDPEFMERMINLVVVSPAAVQRLGTAGFRANPVASGPFRLTQYVKGERIVLERNPRYWRAGRPYVDRLIFRIIPDASTRLIELEAGTVHFAVDMASADLERARRAGLIVNVGKPLGQLNIYMNLKRITDPNVRRAVNHAINRPALVNAVTNNLAAVSFYSMPQAIWTHNPNTLKYDYDVARANRILDEAGWARGADGVRQKGDTRLVWDMPAETIPTRLRAAEIVSAMLREIGIQTRIRPMDPTAFSNTTRGGNYDICWFQWAGSSLDPWPYDGGLNSKYAFNVAQSNDPRLDALLDRALVTLNRQQRQRLYDQYFEIVQRESLFLTVGHLPAVFVARPEARGLRIYTNRLLMEGGWLAPRQ